MNNFRITYLSVLVTFVHTLEGPQQWAPPLIKGKKEIVNSNGWPIKN